MSSDTVQIILDLSRDAQTLLDQQRVDLLYELQQEIPSLKVSYQADPGAPSGRKDIVAILAVTATLVSAITPIVLRVLDMISPPTKSTTWTVEEHKDGTTIRRLQVMSSRERATGDSQTKPPAIDKP